MSTAVDFGKLGGVDSVLLLHRRCVVARGARVVDSLEGYRQKTEPTCSTA
jgi:hypothetical protein